MIRLDEPMVTAVRQSANDAGIRHVVAACDRILAAWRSLSTKRGRPALRADLDLVAEVWADLAREMV